MPEGPAAAKGPSPGSNRGLLALGLDGDLAILDFDPVGKILLSMSCRLCFTRAVRNFSKSAPDVSSPTFFFAATYELNTLRISSTSCSGDVMRARYGVFCFSLASSWRFSFSSCNSSSGFRRECCIQGATPPSSCLRDDLSQSSAYDW